MAPGPRVLVFRRAMVPCIMRRRAGRAKARTFGFAAGFFGGTPRFCDISGRTFQCFRLGSPTATHHHVAGVFPP
jgi:hypothetical protein